MSGWKVFALLSLGVAIAVVPAAVPPAALPPPSARKERRLIHGMALPRIFRRHPPEPGIKPAGMAQEVTMGPILDDASLV